MRKRFPEAKIVLTLGKDGARYSDKDCEYEQPIFPVKAVDTTAAGDTFTGYFLAGLIRGMEIPDILRMSAARTFYSSNQKWSRFSQFQREKK